MDRPNRHQLWADLSLLLVTLIWGSTFVMVKDAIASYPVFSFLTIRFILATLSVLVIGGKRLGSLSWRQVRGGILLGLFLFAGYAFQTIGLNYTSASKTGFITGLYVVIVPLLSAFWLRKSPGKQALIGVVLATIGLGFLSLNADFSIARGDLLVLGCAVSFALHIVAMSVFASDVDPIALTIVQLATVAILSAGSAWLFDTPLAAPASTTWFAAAFTGVLATALAFGIQTAVQRFTTPTHTALIFTGEPVFAAVFGVLLAGDILTGRVVAGGVLIICGTIISEIDWSSRIAGLVSRFLSPQYVALPVLVLLSFVGAESWQQGLVWAVVLSAVSILVPLFFFDRALRRGTISDWHVSDRRERLQPVIALVPLIGAALPLAMLLAFNGPRPLEIMFLAVLTLGLINLAITFRWKISQHVSGIAVSATIVTVVLGTAASPLLLLVPLVAWARVKVGAHTIMQTVAGGIAGVSVGLIALRFWGLA